MSTNETEQARLRDAAGVLWELAGGATEVSHAPWWADGHTMRGGPEGRALGSAHNAERNIAAYIAAMHPGVGLALAAWLDAEAEHIASHDCEAHCEPDGCARSHAALAVADAVLGTTTPPAAHVPADRSRRHTGVGG